MKDNGSLEFGQLPVLLWHDGTHMAQTQAIMRALGMQYGYYPTEAMDRWQVDSTLDAVADIYEDVAKCFFGGAQAAKDEALETLLNEKLPKFLHVMNERLIGKRFLVGHELSIADFALGSFFLQTVCNDFSPHQDRFVAEFQHYERLIEFVKHFHDVNLRYVENMSPNFF
mmetsp:Transcript_12136/g.16473  ORF Transcript_12136/g.16473 Transcript_12136/m.16473 type:complete len:170 (+) Transcript_12136:141-650(+)